LAKDYIDQDLVIRYLVPGKDAKKPLPDRMSDTIRGSQATESDPENPHGVRMANGVQSDIATSSHEVGMQRSDDEASSMASAFRYLNLRYPNFEWIRQWYVVKHIHLALGVLGGIGLGVRAHFIDIDKDIVWFLIPMFMLVMGVLYNTWKYIILDPNPPNFFFKKRIRDLNHSNAFDSEVSKLLKSHRYLREKYMSLTGKLLDRLIQHLPSIARRAMKTRSDLERYQVEGLVEEWQKLRQGISLEDIPLHEGDEQGYLEDVFRMLHTLMVLDEAVEAMAFHAHPRDQAKLWEYMVVRQALHNYYRSYILFSLTIIARHTDQQMHPQWVRQLIQYYENFHVYSADDAQPSNVGARMAGRLKRLAFDLRSPHYVKTPHFNDQERRAVLGSLMALPDVDHEGRVNPFIQDGIAPTHLVIEPVSKSSWGPLIRRIPGVRQLSHQQWGMASRPDVFFEIRSPTS